MALKKKSGSPTSYLDEVPFQINDKYHCPAKVGLPVGLPDGDSVFAAMQYDFSLEREVLARYTDGSGGEKRPQPAAEDHSPPPLAMDPSLAGLGHDAILMPLPASCLGARGPQLLPVTNPGPRNAHPGAAQLHCLKLSDFEREEDPFDKLELKTLDDKEELRSILQSPLQPQPSAGSVPEAAQIGLASHSDSPSPPGTSTYLAAQPCFTYDPNRLVALLDKNRAHSSSPGRGGELKTDDRSCNVHPLTFPQQSHPGDCDPSPLGYSPLPAPGPALQQSLPQKNTLPALPKPQVTVAPEPRGHIKKAPKQTKSGPASLPCGDALTSLTPSERQCVETIVAMGYSYESVLLAMQRQGQNVEQMLDYLFVHSGLCERGFESSVVEECLEMYQCSEEKALQFLELMSRFREMGFEREAIKEALLVHNNDQDKALEDLIARAAAS